LTHIELGAIESITVTRKVKKKTPGTRGGKREGAGRPSIGVRKVRLTLDDETIDKGMDIGDGNLSLGVRIAVKKHKKSPGRKKPL
jgi:hypothetical protein